MTYRKLSYDLIAKHNHKGHRRYRTWLTELSKGYRDNYEWWRKL